MAVRINAARGAANADLNEASEAKPLQAQPLWRAHDVHNHARPKVPGWIDVRLRSFEQEARVTSWILIHEWYQPFLTDTSNRQSPTFFSQRTERALLTEPDSFWEREPDDVMDHIAALTREFPADDPDKDILDTEESAPLRGAAESQTTPPSRERSDDPQPSGQALVVQLQAQTLLGQMDAYWEEIRGKNDLDPDLRERVFVALDALKEVIAEAEANPAFQAGDEDDETAAKDGYLARLYDKCRELAGVLYSVDSVAPYLVSAPIISGCVVLTALIGGPGSAFVTGFAVGSATNKNLPERVKLIIRKMVHE